MPTEKETLDKALEAFKTYKEKGRRDIKTRIARIEELQKAMKEEAARIRPTTK